jgi:hypothetical protein
VKLHQHYVASGSVVILQFSCPLVGCRFRSLRHVFSPCSFIRKLYKGESGDFTVYQFIAFAAATIAANLARF